MPRRISTSTASSTVSNSSYDADRNITYVDGIGLVTADASGDTDGMTLSGGLSAGYDFLAGGLTISPNLGFFYIDATIDGFTESGAGGLNLIYDEQKFKSLTGNAGLRLTYAWNLSWGVLLPQLRVDYVREFEDDVDVFGVRFANDPNAASTPPMLVETDNPDTSYWRLAAGFSAQFKHGISGYVEYQRLESFEFISFQDVSIGLRFQRSLLKERSMTANRFARVFGRIVLVLAPAALVVASAATESDKAAATKGMVKRSDLEIVDCLLPGQVRQLGNSTFLTQRRPIRTTTAECSIRGGEYVAYDRADLKSGLAHLACRRPRVATRKRMTNVGEIYERGLGVAPNYEAAAQWYQKAADKGYSRALFNLGTMYEQGHGVPQDQLKALNLYRQAWGIKEDNIIFASAAQREQDELRKQLEEAIAEKDSQLGLLQKQLKEMQDKLAKQPAGEQDRRQQQGSRGAEEVDRAARERAQQEHRAARRHSQDAHAVGHDGADATAADRGRAHAVGHEFRPLLRDRDRQPELSVDREPADAEVRRGARGAHPRGQVRLHRADPRRRQRHHDAEDHQRSERGAEARRQRADLLRRPRRAAARAASSRAATGCR